VETWSNSTRTLHAACRSVQQRLKGASVVLSRHIMKTRHGQNVRRSGLNSAFAWIDSSLLENNSARVVPRPAVAPGAG
jgi:hypothetical protein